MNEPSELVKLPLRTSAAVAQRELWMQTGSLARLENNIKSVHRASGIVGQLLALTPTEKAFLVKAEDLVIRLRGRVSTGMKQLPSKKNLAKTIIYDELASRPEARCAPAPPPLYQGFPFPKD